MGYPKFKDEDVSLQIQPSKDYDPGTVNVSFFARSLFSLFFVCVIPREFNSRDIIYFQKCMNILERKVVNFESREITKKGGKEKPTKRKAFTV